MKNKKHLPAGSSRIVASPEDHDWAGLLCTFLVLLKDNSPVVDVATGRLLPGLTKARGRVVNQIYLGRTGDGMIPDFEIEVQTKSGQWKIGLLDNNFQIIDE